MESFIKKKMIFEIGIFLRSVDIHAAKNRGKTVERYTEGGRSIGGAHRTRHETLIS